MASREWVLPVPLFFVTGASRSDLPSGRGSRRSRDPGEPAARPNHEISGAPCRPKRSHRQGTGPGGQGRGSRRAGDRAARLSAGARAHLRPQRMTLQIMAERPDGTMSVEDCEAVSRGDFAGSRRRRPDRQGLSSGSVVAGDRPAAGAQDRLRDMGRLPDEARDAPADQRAQALSRQDRRGRAKMDRRRARPGRLRRAGRGRDSLRCHR